MKITQVEVWYRENGNDYRVYGELQAGAIKDDAVVTTTPSIGLTRDVIAQMEAPVYDLLGVAK